MRVILDLKRLDEISVPSHRLISDVHNTHITVLTIIIILIFQLQIGIFDSQTQTLQIEMILLDC